MLFHQATVALKKKINFPDVHDSNVLALVLPWQVSTEAEPGFLDLSRPCFTTAVRENNSAVAQDFISLIFRSQCHNSGEETRVTLKKTKLYRNIPSYFLCDTTLLDCC